VNIPYTHESIRLTGRWDVSDPKVAVTTATGSYLEFAFEGKMALVHFDTFANANPLLHLWIQLDGGDMIEAAISNHLRVLAKQEGKHVCRIIYKGGVENARRWYTPLTGKVSFVGVQTEKPLPLPTDERPTIEFVGDSITEGVLIDTDFTYPNELLSYNGQDYRPYQDDACATYAWLTAEALNLRPVFMGYGAVGVTKAGQGSVPAAAAAYPFNFEGSPISHAPSDYVVINHGANDRGKPAETYLAKYAELLDVIRQYNPKATIIAVSPFCGAFHRELGEMIERYNKENGCSVGYVDTFGWIPEEPLHPMRDGHEIVAQKLADKIKEIIQ
jgi:hypothetical protein